MSKKYEVDETFFDAWSEKMAYALGFILMDGGLEMSHKSPRLQINNAKPDIIEKLKAALAFTGPVTRHVTHKAMGDTTIYRLSVTNCHLVGRLMELGLSSRKSFTVPFPDVPDFYLPHFIRGCHDANGCFGRVDTQGAGKRDSRMTTASRDFAEGYMMAMGRLGIENVRFREDGSGRKNTVYRLRLGLPETKEFCRVIYKDATIWLDYKYEQALEITDLALGEVT